MRRRPGKRSDALLSALLAVGCGARHLDVDASVRGADAADGPAAPDAAADPAAVDASPACRLGAFPLQTCHLGAGELCGHVCANTCVDLATDPTNCGACGVACAPQSACNEGTCGPTPTRLVPPAPGCISIALVQEGGQLIWADVGHGTIKRIATGGGDATTLTQGLYPAVIHPFAGDYEQRATEVAAPILVRNGTVFFIAAVDAPHFGTLPQGISALVGGAGVTIRSVTAGAAPRTLLSAELAPGPSPVSAPDAGADAPNARAVIGAIALSPDGALLYFSAGTRFYSIPSTGALSAADVKYVGFTFGPEIGVATALVADEHRLFYPTTNDDWIELYDFGAPCDAAAAARFECPERIEYSHVGALLDTLVLQGSTLTWAKENVVVRADLTVPDPAHAQHDAIARTLSLEDVTGFAVGPKHVYMGETNGETGLIERGGVTPADGTVLPDPRVLARVQRQPRSLAFDGANVYWTTLDCDIAMIADAPQ